jgi:hypothetical protein
LQGRIGNALEKYQFEAVWRETKIKIYIISYLAENLLKIIIFTVLFPSSLASGTEKNGLSINQLLTHEIALVL